MCIHGAPRGAIWAVAHVNKGKRRNKKTKMKDRGTKEGKKKGNRACGRRTQTCAGPTGIYMLYTMSVQALISEMAFPSRP